MTPKTTAGDPRFMRAALDLARLGLESASPNPMVGAVVVRSGRVVARGYHERPGGPHAEIHALEAAGRRARGAEIYVTLEPCAHHGRTPPCADAIARAGIARVHYAAADPNPLTRGRGPRLLRARGVEVHAGLLGREARRLNAPYLHWMARGMPWCILKWAMSLDGKIATRRGESRWITGPEARAAAHGLRRRADAILVGTRTALRDDPLLTPRPARGRSPRRVVLDRRGRLPLELRLLEAPGRGQGPVLYVTSRRAPPRRLRVLERRGIEILQVREAEGGLDLEATLAALAARGVCQLLVEGGGSLAGGLLALGLVQEVAAFVAPVLIGGEGAPGPLEGPGISALESALELEEAELRALGRDWLIQGRVRR